MKEGCDLYWAIDAWHDWCASSLFRLHSFHSLQDFFSYFLYIPPPPSSLCLLFFSLVLRHALLMVGWCQVPKSRYPTMKETWWSALLQWQDRLELCRLLNTLLVPGEWWGATVCVRMCVRACTWWLAQATLVWMLCISASWMCTHPSLPPLPSLPSPGQNPIWSDGYCQLWPYVEPVTKEVRNVFTLVLFCLPLLPYPVRTTDMDPTFDCLFVTFGRNHLHSPLIY